MCYLNKCIAIIVLMVSQLWAIEGTELVNKRTFFSKTYQISQNNYVIRMTAMPIHYFNKNGEFVEIDSNSPQAAANRQTAIDQYLQTNPQDNWLLSSGPSGAIFQYQYDDGNTSGTDYVNSMWDGYVGRDDDLETANWNGDYNHIYRGYVYWSLNNLPEDDNIVWDNFEVNVSVDNIWNNGFSTVSAKLLPVSSSEVSGETGWQSIASGTALGSFNATNNTGAAFIHTSVSGQPLYTAFVNAATNNVSGYIGIGFMVNGTPSDGQMIEMSSSGTFDCYYHIDDVDLTLANKYKDDNNTVHNLTSTTLDLYGNGYNYNQVPSGTSKPVAPGGQYTVETNNWNWTWNSAPIKQHHWNSNNNHYKIKRTFTLGNWSDETAWYENIKTIVFQSPVQIEIKDPWFVETDESQPNNYQQITSGQWDVFLNQGGEIGNLTPPYYKLQAQTGYNDGPINYSFDRWSVSPANGATFTDPTNYLTPVIFNTPGAVITANYRPTNALTGNISGGALPDGYYFDGDVVINSYTYVPSGSFFGVMPGTHITINGGSGLRIYGDFEAVGTSRQPITFTGDGGLGVQISGEGSSEFRHSRFEGIMVESQITGLGECIFDECSFSYNNNIALSAFGGGNNTEINNCSITNSAYGMISGLYSTLKIMNTDFINNDIGIYSLLNDESEIRFNTFTNNGTGLFTTASSIPYLWKDSPEEWLCDRENNVFTGNNTAVKAEFESYPMLGEYIAPPVNGYSTTGWNRFYSNGTDIINNNDFSLFAVGNNWYAPNPPGVAGCSESSPDNIVGNVQWQPTVFGLVGNNVIFPPDVPVLARQAEGEGDITRALSRYDDMVINKMNVSAVYGVARCLWQQGNVPGILNKMDQYSQMFPNSPIEEQSLSIMTSYKLYSGGNVNLNEALQTIDYIKLNYPDTALDPKLLFEKAKIQQKLQGNGKVIAGYSEAELPGKAKQAYMDLVEKYPDTPYGMLASIMVGKQAKETAETIPATFTLHPAFPNPFNPVTTINYDLPQDSRIELTVYNIMGQEVKTLTDGYKQAGIHAVTWNGINNHNEPVSSGMYLVRLTTQKSIQTQKLVLMK